MSASNSPIGSIDFNFEDDDYRRPRRAAAAASNRNAFVESGTDDEEPGSKRKNKRAGGGGKRAKRQRHQTESSESDEDEDKEMDMRNLTEKERELQIFKHIEHQELLKARKEIQQKLMGGDVDEEKLKPKKKRADEPSSSKISQAAPAPPAPTRSSDKESGEESSSSDDDVPKSKSPSPEEKTKESSYKEESEESEEEEIQMDTEFHKPSDIAKKMDKKNAIADLVKLRKEKKQNEVKKKEQVLDFNQIFGGGKEEKSESDDSSSSDSSDSESEESDNDGDSGSNKPSGEEVSSFEQLNAIRLSRFKLAKLCHAPFFDKTVLGCFVRVGVGQSNGVQVYRAAQVVGVVDSTKIYNVENTRTNKALRLKHGPDERVWRLEYVSNQEITNNEYFKWRDSMKKSRLPLPTTDYIEKKRNDIITALNYQFTDEDVKKMVEQKKKFLNVPTNQAAHKAELLKMKLDADQSGDIAKSNELQIQIDRIDEIIKKKELERCHDSLGITAINQRNRDTQQKALAEKSLRKMSIDTEDDPFTRKSGKMRVVAGRMKREDGTMEEVKPDTKTMAPKASSSATLNHSASAPQLNKYGSLLTEMPVPKQAPQILPSSQSSMTSSAIKAGGGISFAEFRRRKLEAAGKL